MPSRRASKPDVVLGHFQSSMSDSTYEYTYRPRNSTVVRVNLDYGGGENVRGYEVRSLREAEALFARERKREAGMRCVCPPKGQRGDYGASLPKPKAKLSNAEKVTKRLSEALRRNEVISFRSNNGRGTIGPWSAAVKRPLDERVFTDWPDYVIFFDGRGWTGLKAKYAPMGYKIQTNAPYLGQRSQVARWLVDAIGVGNTIDALKRAKVGYVNLDTPIRGGRRTKVTERGAPWGPGSQSRPGWEVRQYNGKGDLVGVTYHRKVGPAALRAVTLYRQGNGYREIQAFGPGKDRQFFLRALPWRWGYDLVEAPSHKEAVKRLLASLPVRTRRS